MKNLLLALFMLCGISMSLFGHQHNPSNEEVKIYVSASSISVEDNGIYINEGNDRLPVDTLHVDSNGVYVIIPEVREHIRRCNRGHDILCQCGRCCEPRCPNACRCW